MFEAEIVKLVDCPFDPVAARVAFAEVDMVPCGFCVVGLFRHHIFSHRLLIDGERLGPDRDAVVTAVRWLDPITQELGRGRLAFYFEHGDWAHDARCANYMVFPHCLRALALAMVI